MLVHSGYNQEKKIQITKSSNFIDRTALPGFFLCIFRLPFVPEGTCFQQVGSSAVEEGSQPSHTRISDLQKVPARLSLFLKGEKIPALLYGGKGPEYMPFSDFRPIPSAYWPRAKISNHGKASTQVLFLYRTIFSSHLHTSLFKSLFSNMCKYLSNN